MPEDAGRKPVLVLLAVAGVSGALALAVLLRGGSGPQAPAKPAASASRVWPEAEGPRVLDAAMLSNEPNRSSVDLVERPLESAKGGEVPPSADPSVPGGSEGSRSAAAGSSGAAGPGTGDGGAPALSGKESSMLGGLLGGDIGDPAKASALGASTDGLWTKVMKGIARYPKVMKAVLDNKYVVKGFFADPKNAKMCSSPAAARSYLTDTKAPGGVTHAMNVFDAVIHGDKGMPSVVFGSKLADAIMSCPSTQSIIKDKDAIGEIASANPRMMAMMVDPSVMLGLTSSPAVSAGFSSVQSSLPR